MTIFVRKNQEFTDLLQRNLISKHEVKRRLVNSQVHVSDILPATCIRKQYYSRKFPTPLSNESVHHFVRGESSEFIITQLADLPRDISITKRRMLYQKANHYRLFG